jgi:hypothetical protein
MTAKGTDPSCQQSNDRRDVKDLSKKLKLFISEPRHPIHRHGVSHHHGSCDCTIVNSDGNRNKKINMMQLPPCVPRNCTAFQGHQPLKK